MSRWQPTLEDFPGLPPVHNKESTKYESAPQINRNQLLYIKNSAQKNSPANNKAHDTTKILAYPQIKIDSKNITSSSYVMNLNDGDGVIFQPKYIIEGFQGGKNAAQDLLTELLRTLPDTSVEIRCIFFLNVDGLANAMKSHGLIKKSDVLRNFLRGFKGRGNGYVFEFLDVGYGKDNADMKIKAYIKKHSKSPDCLHFFLGIPHDHGYASTLQGLRQNGWRDKVTMIQSLDILPVLSKFRFPTLKLSPTIFLPKKIGDPTSPRNGKRVTKTKAPAGSDPASLEHGYKPSTPPWSPHNAEKPIAEATEERSIKEAANGDRAIQAQPLRSSGRPTGER